MEARKVLTTKGRFNLMLHAVGDLKTADLNGDGWLDIIACSYNDIANNRQFDMGTYIFWGSGRGLTKQTPNGCQVLLPLDR
jgi:hypothetical protein